MTTGKKLGIWMDHSNAHLMEFTTDIKTEIIESEFDHQEKESSLRKGEITMHNKEHHKQAEYNNKLKEVIRNYDEVLLFGPTDAKVELYKNLKGDHLFEKIKVEVKQTDKMTEHQEHAFVREHFSPTKFHPHTI